MLNLHLMEAKRKLKRFRLFGTTASMLRATKTYLTSARAMRSTFQRQTWKIVWTGQVLRKRALRAEESTKAEELAKHPPKPMPAAGPVAPLKPKTSAPAVKSKSPAKR
jgi:hypothetical protein